jgi:hypothetical protein
MYSKTFLKTGIIKFREIFSQKDCKKISNYVFKKRKLKNVFLNKKDYLKQKNIFQKTNPKPGKNLLHKLNTSFIFDNSRFNKILTNVLGKNYRVLDYKLVVGFPKNYIPEWISTLTKDDNTINLGRFIKPEFRDITYFKGIDFHQDIIDWPSRSADFITAYIYLENVNLNSSPLFLLPKSFKLGANPYPHNLELIKNKISYKVGKKKILSKISILTGNAGDLFIWHPFILHGTKPQNKDRPRVSVRILVEKNRHHNIDCLLDKINSNISGKKKLKITNKEFNNIKKTFSKKNFINKI